MKQILTILTLTAAFSSLGQCPSVQCDASFTLPIQTNDYNNNQAAHKCINGTGTYQNNLNGGNWESLSFSGTIIVDQTININQSKRVFAFGNITFNHATFAGGQDSSNLYIGTNSTVIFPNGIQAANNFYNYIFIGSNSTVTVSGTQYYPGDVLQSPGNSTNVVHFVACSGSPLPIVFEKFEFRNGYIRWKVNSKERLQMEYASTAAPQDWRTDCTLLSHEGYQKASGGYYRLRCGQERSEIIFVDYKQLPPQNVIYYLNGKFYDTPPPNVHYYGIKKLN